MTQKKTARIRTTPSDYNSAKMMPSYGFVFSDKIEDWIVSNCVQAVAKQRARDRVKAKLK